MTDFAERMARVEEAQRGLNTYLPLLLKRFEGIEDRLEADLKAIEQKLEANIKETRQDVKAVEQKLEANIKETQQDVKAVEQDVKALHRDNRVLLATLILSALVVAASIYFT